MPVSGPVLLLQQYEYTNTTIILLRVLPADTVCCRFGMETSSRLSNWFVFCFLLSVSWELGGIAHKCVCMWMDKRLHDITLQCFASYVAHGDIDTVQSSGITGCWDNLLVERRQRRCVGSAINYLPPSTTTHSRSSSG